MGYALTPLQQCLNLWNSYLLGTGCLQWVLQCTSSNW